MPDVLDAYWNYTSNLKQADLDWLISQGVSADALAHDPDEIGFLIAKANVVFDDDANGFSFASEIPDHAPTAAYTILARDEDGEIADIVAWRPRDSVVAAWARRVPLAGMQNLYAARLDEPLRVFRDPVEWLRSDRHGVIVLDARQACHWLRGAGEIEARSSDHARHLRRAFADSNPRIVIPSKFKDAA
jgi:hypothetical protein